MLTSIAGADPPIDWPDLPFAFAASLIGVLFVVGLQLMRRDPAYSRWALRLFGLIAVWAAAAGVSGFVIAVIRRGVTPSALFFLSIGAALLIGVWLCRLLFRRKFAVAP